MERWLRVCAPVCGGIQVHCDGFRTCNYSAEPFRCSGELRGSLICIGRYSPAFDAGASTRGVHARTRNALTSANKHLSMDHQCNRTRSTENGETSALHRITDALTAFDRASGPLVLCRARTLVGRSRTKKTTTKHETQEMPFCYRSARPVHTLELYDRRLVYDSIVRSPLGCSNKRREQRISFHHKENNHIK